jgi:hypothetical protein
MAALTAVTVAAVRKTPAAQDRELPRAQEHLVKAPVRFTQAAVEADALCHLTVVTHLAQPGQAVPVAELPVVYLLLPILAVAVADTLGQLMGLLRPNQQVRVAPALLLSVITDER